MSYILNNLYKIYFSHSWSQGISQVKRESFVSKSNNSVTRENKIKKKRSNPAPVPIRHTFTSYQNQLIQSASRKSATSAATAALAAANVVAGAIGETPQKAFIPSSKAQGAKEFNVVATVSKASREANRLNATLASKYFIYHSITFISFFIFNFYGNYFQSKKFIF
jgi:hypothetical protein